MRLSDPFVSASFAALFFSALLCLSLASTGRRQPLNYSEPNSPLPSQIKALMPATGKPFVGPVPWSVSRKTLTCVLSSCTSGSAYVASLPVLQYGETATWNDDLNTWHLSTQEHFRTGWPVQYPAATVLVVPANTPKHVKFLVDQRFSDNAFIGLRPLILANNALLDMGPNWNSELALEAAQGRNLTGNFAHSFVLHNTSKHEVYFAKKHMTDTERQSDWWACPAGSWTLFWPNDIYFSLSSNAIKWNAYRMPEATTNDFAAYVAETMMFAYLAPQAPTA